MKKESSVPKNRISIRSVGSDHFRIGFSDIRIRSEDPNLDTLTMVRFNFAIYKKIDFITSRILPLLKYLSLGLRIGFGYPKIRSGSEWIRSETNPKGSDDPKNRIGSARIRIGFSDRIFFRNTKRKHN